jgi:hypothetical protein
MFDEAVRVGSKSATEATKQIQVNRVLVEAIGTTLDLIKSGRITLARERLERALIAAAQLAKS